MLAYHGKQGVQKLKALVDINEPRKTNGHHVTKAD